MRSLLAADEEEKDRKKSEQPEINLSAASLLGLFVGLVLICGVFFGLGYSVGRRATAAPATPSNSASANASGAAPSPSSSETQEATGNTPTPVSGDASSPVSGPSSPMAQSAMVDLPIDETPPPEVQPSTGRTAEKQSTPASPAEKPQAYPAAQAPAAAPASASAAAPVSAPANAAPPPSGETMVQVAAVAHREDADVLVSALRQHGYSAVVRTEPQDKLLHVQVGPYASRAQALEMRQKLLADGYNAIVK